MTIELSEDTEVLLEGAPEEDESVLRSVVSAHKTIRIKQGETLRVNQRGFRLYVGIGLLYEAGGEGWLAISSSEGATP